MCQARQCPAVVADTLIRMLKDDRVRKDQERSIFNIRDVSDRLG